MEQEELKYTEDGRQIDFSGIVVNQDNTPLEDLKLNTYPIEIQEQFMDFISNVPFIKNCISIDKPRACDMPKDEQGRIIINIGEVHHLENIDYFRPTAINFQKTGKVTNLRPNANPNSEFGKWFKEEIRRCWEGYVRKEDGEWITGDMYFFLNYCPIMQSKIKQGSKKAIRIWDFPEFWEGHYYKFHYINQARDKGLHGAELAARGRGKSFSLAAMIAKRFILGESIETTKEVKCLVTAYQKEFLNKDGVLNKFQSYIDFCAQNTQFPSQKLKNSLNEMQWTMGYFDLDTQTRKGTLNEVLGVSSKDDESRLRGKRGSLIGIEEFGTFKNLLGLYGTLRPSMEEGDYSFGIIFMQGCCVAGTQVIMQDGNSVNIEDLKVGDIIKSYNGINLVDENITYIQTEAYKDCYRIELENGQYLECSYDHPILCSLLDEQCEFIKAENISVGTKVCVIPYNNNTYKLKFKETVINKCSHLNDHIYEKLGISKVIKVEYIGRQRIYNMTANTTHTYISNGFISANTAGDKDSDFHAAETIMYQPIGYHMNPVKNVYDKIGQGRKNFVYFFPGFINRKGCYDKDGNSDVTKAILEILIERYTVKHNATDVNAIAKAISEIPITPQEAIIKADGSLFPIAQLSERLNQIDNNPSEYDDVYVGSLVQESNGEVKYIPTNEVPIHIFPTKDNKLSGALEIFQMPEKDREGKIHPNRYIMAYDPVAADQADTMSLASVFVMDLFTDQIVAEYTGRQIYEDQNHEIVRLLCLFYNAKCMYENNIKGCYAYFARMNCLHLLADTPDYLRDKQLVKTVGWGNTSKGIRATKPINAFGDQLIKDWLLKPVPKVVTDEDGNPKEISMPNLYNLRNRALIEEMIQYNPYINVDRIRALSSLMLYREEKMIIYQGNITGNDEEYDSTYLGNDDFFNRNYDKRQKFLKY